MKDLISDLSSFTYKLAWGDVPILKWAAAALASAWTYVAGANAGRLVLAAAGLILLDVLTGVSASWVERKPIQSRVFGRTIAKLLAYASTILVVAVMAREVAKGHDAAMWSVSGVAALVIVREMHSILENVVRCGILLPAGLLDKLRTRLGLEGADQ